MKMIIDNWQLYITSVAILVMLYYYVKGKIKERKRLGKLKRKSKRRAEGIIFGKSGFLKVICSPSTAEGHCVAFGGSGVGKTSALLIPTLRAWRGNSFVIDLSHDINKNVPDPEKLIFEPLSDKSRPFSVFAYTDTLQSKDEQDEQLQQLSFSLIPQQAKDDTNKYYETQSRNLLQSALVAYYHAGLDFVPICKKIVGLPMETLLEDLNASGNELAMRLIASYEGMNEKTLSATKQELDSSIMLFAVNTSIERTVKRAENAITPHLLQEKSIYIVIDDVKLELYSPLFRLITAQTMEYLFSRPIKAKPSVILCLDEFSSMGKMDITPALRKLRKKNVRIIVMTQSLADLDLIYGKDERKAMLDNFNFKVVMSATEYETQKYFSDLAGEITVAKYSYNMNGEHFGETVTDQREKLIYPEEFGRLDKHLILFHPKGVMWLKKNYYFKWYDKYIPRR